MDTLLRRREMMVAGNSAPAPVFHTRLFFDGTAYIDTDVVIPEDGTIRIPVGYETEKKAQVIVNAGGKIFLNLGGSTNNTSRAFLAAYDTSSPQVSGTTRTLAWTYNAYSMFLTPKRFGIGSTTTNITKGTSHPTTGIVFGQNAAHTNTPFTGAINGFVRIYGSDAQNATSYSDLDNYTPVATFRPCTYNGEAGLWCVQTSTFYGNTAGAGTLTCGD